MDLKFPVEAESTTNINIYTSHYQQKKSNQERKDGTS